MKNKDKIIYIAEKAQENLSSAEILLSKGFYNAASSRMYYAVFQMVYCQLILNGEADPQSKKGGNHKQAMDFLEKDLGRTDETTISFRRLEGRRSKADYWNIRILQEDCERDLDVARSCFRLMYNNYCNGKEKII